MPGAEKTTDQWSAEARFAVIVETATLSEAEVAEYCRKKGLSWFSGGRDFYRRRIPVINERQQFILWINEAVTSGARRAIVCREVQLSLRT